MSYVSAQPKIVSNGNIRGSEYWVNSGSLSFTRIIQDSKVPPKWIDSATLDDLGYKDKILRPINPYVHHFGIKPELEILRDGCIILKQKTHAEIWIEMLGRQIYLLDKCWQRQFYPSVASSRLVLDRHVNAIFKFYTPWIIDADIKVDVFSYEDSPFTILTDSLRFSQVDKNQHLLDSSWVNFAVKSDSKYIIDEENIIPKDTYMYGIMITDKEVSDRIIKEYEE
jgi:hypothetical protein